MKKNVTYKVDVSVDKHGAINECQCECAVGMGPNAHCKHVQCLLFALMSFTTTETILTNETCTQKLQTFHHCRRYKGSPLKASQLSLRKSESTRDIKNKTSFDPRPTHLRNMEGYGSFFNNMCINYQASRPTSEQSSKSSVKRSSEKSSKIHVSSKKSRNNDLPMPILQTIPPANMYAVANDHDYLKQHPEEMFLQTFGVLNITPEQRATIEQNTRRQSEDALWYKERRKRLQSSRFGRICKATARTDKLKLAESFLNVDKIESAPLLHGKKYEPIAVQEYEKINAVQTQPCGIFVCATLPFLGSSPDRVIDSDTVLEVKCPYVSKDRLITPVTVPYLKEVDGELTLNRQHEYYYQVQGQLLCSDRQVCEFVVYTLKDIRVFRIERDETFITSMVSDLKEFFNLFFKPVLLTNFFYKKTDKYVFYD